MGKLGRLVEHHQDAGIFPLPEQHRIREKDAEVLEKLELVLVSL
jgi:hypothetical protein